MSVRMILLGAAGVALGATFAVSAIAQDSSAKPGKKVWTNEDLQDLRSKTPVSVVGAPPAAPAKRASGAAATNADPAKNGQWYRERLQPLRAELAKLDHQLDDLRGFEDGSYRSSGGGVSRGYLAPLNPAEEIKKLAARKDEIQARVSALEDEARHNGILPGELR
jgi:hypothetical protein